MNAKLPLKLKTDSPQDDPSSSRLLLWLDKLPKYSLSLIESVVKKVRYEFGDPNTDSERLANIIEHEPALCLKLFLRAHRQLRQREGDVQGIVHLLGLLGWDQVETVLKKAKTHQGISDGQHWG